MSIDFDIDEEKQDEPLKVGEKGFGTCTSCGKKTMGKSNTLCSRCGGTSVWRLLGYDRGDDSFVMKESHWEHARRGYTIERKNHAA